MEHSLREAQQAIQGGTHVPPDPPDIGRELYDLTTGFLGVPLLEIDRLGQEMEEGLERRAFLGNEVVERRELFQQFSELGLRRARLHLSRRLADELVFGALLLEDGVYLLADFSFESLRLGGNRITHDHFTRVLATLTERQSSLSLASR